MNADGHKAKANEIKSSLEELLPDAGKKDRPGVPFLLTPILNR